MTFRVYFDNERSVKGISDQEAKEWSFEMQLKQTLGVASYRKHEREFNRRLAKFREHRDKVLSDFPALVGRNGIIEWTLKGHLDSIISKGNFSQPAKTQTSPVDEGDTQG